jgi:2-dehydro-3-deoxy-D-arabinonate dehydratase
MLLTRHQTPRGPRWAADNHLLAELFDLRMLLAMQREDIRPFVEHTQTTDPVAGSWLAPLEMTQEVWVAPQPDRLGMAQRPTLFFKAIGWRALGQQQAIRIRADSVISVPQPGVTLIVNQRQEVVGYTLGIDVTASDLGDLPQAKIYDGACALGPGLQLLDGDTLPELSVTLEVVREARSTLRGEAVLRLEPQQVADWIAWLYREMSFPHGAFLMLGLPLTFPADFTLQRGDRVSIAAGALTLENTVALA